MLNFSNLCTICLFGFISGFTLMIPGNTLNYWLAKENIPLESISIFAFINIPYAINFLWAPIFDTMKLGILDKILGPRLSWIFTIQILLILSIFTLSYTLPDKNLVLFAVIAFIISFLSSAQDTILGAFRTEMITKESQGAASGIYIFGYRIGMLVSGSGAIYLSFYIEFNNIYKIFAVCILIYSLLLLVSTIRFKNILNHIIDEKTMFTIYSFAQNILQPIGSLSFIILILVFLVLYRLPDNFINIMINPFLIKLGYDEFEIASTGKFFGVIGAIVGGLFASLIMKKKNIIDSLFIFGIIHAGAHILFIIQEIYGKNMKLLFVVIGFESITGGMAMTAYIAFIASLCHGKFRATQYSFFSSMMGFSRSIFPALSGYIVISCGWQNFFIFTTILILPSLFVLLKIKNKRRVNFPSQSLGSRI